MAVVKVNGIQYSLTECKGDGHSGMVRARFSTLFGGSDARQRERERNRPRFVFQKNESKTSAWILEWIIVALKDQISKQSNFDLGILIQIKNPNYPLKNHLTNRL